MQIAQKAAARGETSLETVVVLCADEVVRDAIAYWFSSPPAQALVAADGYEASRLLNGNACGLLVTDRILPPWPGLDTFLHLRSVHPQLRIAFVDDGSPDARSLARVTGAQTVLSRPLTRQSVLAAWPRAAVRSR